MYKVVGVRFKDAGKIYYFNPDNIELTAGDGVIVETARGMEYGAIVIEEKEVEEEEIVAPLKKDLRKATEKDEVMVEENLIKEKEAFNLCQDKIREHNLPMKLINVEYTFDTSKIIFYFTADGRVDFRDLVKDLASVFRTRIELRQIGVRDEAKMIGGVGPCGRQLCCTTFMGEFDPVSIRMAKTQNLSLNPTKISGICGRLMCCLKFECETYNDANKEFPEEEQLVSTPHGKGIVMKVDIPRRIVRVKLENGKEEKYPLKDIEEKCPCAGDQCPKKKE